MQKQRFTVAGYVYLASFNDYHLLRLSMCVPIKCIWPDPVEYVPAMQELQSREPAGEEE